MPIPAIDTILNVLPPLLDGSDGTISLSPYKCTMAELCDRYAKSEKRVEILKGLLQFRAECRSRGIQGFHWIAGSFIDDIMILEGREPNDIDAVTFVSVPDTSIGLKTAINIVPVIKTRAHVKATYQVDHVFFPLKSAPSSLVSNARYWYGLYSHTLDRTWKGILRVELTADVNEDKAAADLLLSRP